MAFFRSETNIGYIPVIQCKKVNVNQYTTDKVVVSHTEYELVKESLKRFRKIMSTYNYQWLWTVTVERKCTLGSDVAIRNHVKQMLDNEKIAYVIVTEYQKNGTIHFHIILDKLPTFINKKGVFYGANKSKPFDSHYSLEVKKLIGLNWCLPLPSFYTPDYMIMVKYLSKYLHKDLTDRPIYSRKRKPSITLFDLINNSDYMIKSYDEINDNSSVTANDIISKIESLLM